MRIIFEWFLFFIYVTSNLNSTVSFKNIYTSKRSKVGWFKNIHSTSSDGSDPIINEESHNTISDPTINGEPHKTITDETIVISANIQNVEAVQQTSSTDSTATTVKPPIEEVDNGYYISCGSCKSVFLYKNAKELENGIGARGTRVKCCVCDKQWFQGIDKVSKIDNQVSFLPISQERAEEMKKFIMDNNWARNPRGEKIDLFIGNLPFNFDENDIGDLFAEYGVVNVSLVRDTDRQSKGFAFIELSTKADAELAIREMDSFFLDNQRRLVVKLSIRNTAPPPGGASSHSAANASGTSGDRATGTGPAWTKTTTAGSNPSKPPSSSASSSSPGSTGGGGGKSVWVPRSSR